tara:strand:- start:2200 stop:2817 length:618 start_codon:yes stop_codon:yes gene_type:complete
VSRARDIADFNASLFADDEISGDKVSGGTIGAGTFNGTIGSSANFPGGESGSFAGLIIQSKMGSYTCSGDIKVFNTAEVYGPIVSMQMKNANAKVVAIVTHGELYANTSENGGSTCRLRVAYKASSFSAGQGETGQGVTSLAGSQMFVRSHDTSSCTVVDHGTLSNIAGATMHFAPEAVSTSGFFYPNFGGSHANITLKVFELSQ